MATRERGKEGQQQDTPGRPDPSSSRQQTHPNQGTQTGSPSIDADSSKSAKPKRQKDLSSLPDRPAED